MKIPKTAETICNVHMRAMLDRSQADFMKRYCKDA